MCTCGRNLSFAGDDRFCPDSEQVFWCLRHLRLEWPVCRSTLKALLDVLLLCFVVLFDALLLWPPIHLIFAGRDQFDSKFGWVPFHMCNHKDILFRTFVDMSLLFVLRWKSWRVSTRRELHLNGFFGWCLNQVKMDLNDVFQKPSPYGWRSALAHFHK